MDISETSVGIPVDICLYRKSDRDRLIQTIDSVCSEGLWMSTLRYEPTPAWEHALLQDGCEHHLLLVAKYQQRVIGWIRLFPIDDGHSMDIGIGLRREYRERGIGTRMLNQAIQWASSRELSYLYAWSRPENGRAIHLFNKFGFLPTGKQENGFVELRRTK